jgi:hypothetical protein
MVTLQNILFHIVNNGLKDSRAVLRVMVGQVPFAISTQGESRILFQLLVHCLLNYLASSCFGEVLARDGGAISTVVSADTKTTIGACTEDGTNSTPPRRICGQPTPVHYLRAAYGRTTRTRYR